MALQADIVVGGMGVNMIVPVAAVQNFSIRAQPRGSISRLRVVQLRGLSDGFTARFYNKQTAADPVNLVGGLYVLSLDAELYRIAPAYVVPTGSYGGDQEMLGKGYAYANLDATGSDLTPRLYMHLEVAGGILNKAFGVSLCIDVPTGI